jgi:transcriptional regulator with XRE-family HTH domain
LTVRYPEFGERVRAALKAAGLSTRDVETALKVKYEMARRYALGVAKPRDAKMRLLSQLLNCSEAWLSFGEDAATPAGRAELTPRQAEWMKLMAKLSEKQQDIIEALMEDLVHANKGKRAPK